MIGYITIGVKDLEKGKAYWTEVLAPLGAKIVMDGDRMALLGTGPGNAMLGICLPYDKKEAHPGNGTMLGITAGSRANVDLMYKKAIELGGTDEGEPGDRGGNFYGGYFRDPDGNKAVFFDTSGG